MRIPYSIDANTRLAYGPSDEAKSTPAEVKRKLQAEDTDWDAHTPSSLMDLCTQKLPAFMTSSVPCEVRDLMLETLSTNLPLPVAVKFCQDGIYWKRRTLERWNAPTNVEDSGGSWKQYFMEKHVQEYIESLPVEAYDTEELEELCSLVKDYVYRLDVRELQVLRTYFEDEDEKPRDRIDLKPVFIGLSNMTEFHLQFGVRNVGTNYKKNLVQFTSEDCRNIGRGVSKAVNLRLLRIHNSELDDSKMVALLSHMQANKTLQSLDFSHCRLGDEGAAALAKFISQRKSILKLDICNNKVRAIGVKALAFILTQEPACGLQELSLRLNTFGDEGAKYLFSALTRKAPALRALNISCTGLGEDSGVLLGEVLARNESLVNVNISNNQLGDAAAPVILREMVSNSSLQFLDLRMTGVSKMLQLEIETLLHNNRCRSKSADLDGDDTVFYS